MCHLSPGLSQHLTEWVIEFVQSNIRYGFNPVSTLSFADMKVATRVGVTTTISACTGGITVLLISMLYGNPPMVSSVVNGILSGLVGITAPCAVVKPYLALVIGAVSGVLYYHASAFLKRFAIDDPLDASPLHYVCGMWGTVAVGLFASKEYMAHVRGVDVSETTPYAGLLMGGNGMQLGVQLAGCASVTAWAVFFCTVMFSCLNACNMFRVPAMDEILGLDIAQHGGKAYNDAFRSESYSQEAAELHWERQEIAELGISKASDAKLDNPNKWTSQDSLTGMNLLPGTIP